MIDVGSRVRIDLSDPGSWSVNTAALIQGEVGVVRERRVHPWPWSDVTVVRYMVGFSPPLQCEGAVVRGVYCNLEDLVEENG